MLSIYLIHNGTSLNLIFNFNFSSLMGVGANLVWRSVVRLNIV